MIIINSINNWVNGAVAGICGNQAFPELPSHFRKWLGISGNAWFLQMPATEPLYKNFGNIRLCEAFESQNEKQKNREFSDWCNNITMKSPLHQQNWIGYVCECA